MYFMEDSVVTVSPAIRKKEKLARQKKKTISEKSLVLPD